MTNFHCLARRNDEGFGKFQTINEAGQFLEERGWRRVIPRDSGGYPYWRKDDKTDVSDPCWTTLECLPDFQTKPLAQIPEAWLYPEVIEVRERLAALLEEDAEFREKLSTLFAGANTEKEIRKNLRRHAEKQKLQEEFLELVSKVVPWQS